ncbi:MAG: nucleoside deaminase [Candidatus Dadabacteria bacterium]|nr:MAG: nucleoside deaminase [Candidatus Dadabacteria bacterium]
MEVRFEVPDWLSACNYSEIYRTDDEKMGVALDLARISLEHGAGGPFGAAIFDESGRVISVGVNLVLLNNSSLLHGEIVAIALAQKKAGSWNLRELGDLCLATSAFPCSMCYGAILWSGLSQVMYGAERGDIEKLTGFREGILPERWREELNVNGIEIRGPVCRERAKDVLRGYKERGGVIYNP